MENYTTYIDGKATRDTGTWDQRRIPWIGCTYYTQTLTREQINRGVYMAALVGGEIGHERLFEIILHGGVQP